mmetsp:Transcript_63329/g.206572  ORF Transcript_63329/g.206572 Transcript_63329/m.206572 type:complete len:272 (+) Transcript_63329:131-946(+)|eukprot:CAMPEP_0203889816 /NCGR_PEP_ID=MMETSP0359-20131031/33339_1 /ASSEMBLY_ACC=CAM_ASM_000338 /TAXON_ID=268821 /ORGANISM="Scrippsiella Hangoei, Strain SHTV-5" /LENGTH=271 /DNA_ID=CAMNT_0050811309 /DNA_START=61 /DNA_END=876 /DNA_ORIENTATION=-
MIHSFLETLVPVESDDDDDDSPDVEFAFSIKASAPAGAGTAVTPEQCVALVVCGPGAAAAYASCALPLAPMPWALEVVKETLVRTFPPPPKSPRFFVGRGSGEAGEGPVVVAVLDAAVPGDMAAAWAEALLSAFPAATEVAMLDRIFRAGWRTSCGQERPQEPHLCGLWTAAYGASGPLDRADALALLPAPNAVEGLAAALLSRCEASRRRGLVALGLQDGAHLGEGTLSAFEKLGPLLRRLGLVQEGGKVPDYREAIRQNVPSVSMSIYA